ncbi:MAG: hypothetical protein SVK44_01610 [Nitrospirota bacterium]|jgi:F-type H+-transporting ATPase subunit b|nr:hypothetical protein [Nitrospirota bacterium]
MAPKVFPDWTVFIQMAIFLLAYLVVKVLVIRPYSRLKGFREGLTSKRIEEAQALVQKAEALKASYEASLTEARKEADSNRDAIFKGYEQKARGVEAQAKKELHDLLQLRQKQIQESLEAMESQFRGNKELLKQLFFEVLTGKRPKRMG